MATLAGCSRHVILARCAGGVISTDICSKIYPAVFQGSVINVGYETYQKSTLELGLQRSSHVCLVFVTCPTAEMTEERAQTRIGLVYCPEQVYSPRNQQLDTYYLPQRLSLFHRPYPRWSKCRGCGERG